MFRRETLGLFGVAMTAGCAGLAGRGTPREPPVFSVSVEAPEEVRLGDTFDVRISVTNTGGQPGTYTGAVTAFAGMSDETTIQVTVGPVAPGESRQGSFGPVVAAYAGGWTVELDEESHAVDVLPATRSQGESVELSERVRLTVRDSEVRDSYDYQKSSGESGTRMAAPGFRFIFADVTVENVGSGSEWSPSRSQFAGADSDGLYPVYFGPDRWSEMRLGGVPYPGKRRLDASDSVSGWVALTVRDGTETAVVWNRDRVTSPPEAVWRV